MSTNKSQITNEAREQTICWTCRYMHNSNTRNAKSFVCQNEKAYYKLKERGFTHIPDIVLGRGCSYWESKRKYKPEPKKEVNQQRSMF